jgi:hypothetical protein
MTGNDIKAIRECFGLTREELARFAATSPRTLEKWERATPEKTITDGPWTLPLTALQDLVETIPSDRIRKIAKQRVDWCLPRGGVVHVIARYLRGRGSGGKARTGVGGESES